MQKCLAFLITSTFAFGAMACEPCMQTLSLDETYQQADLVILAESTPFDPDKMSKGDYNSDGIAEIDATVVKVLKGTYPEKTIRLKSWYGMCPYGFVFRYPQEVIAIKAKEEGVYTRINDGCDKNQLPYKDGLVDGKESLDDFVKNHLEKKGK